MAASPAESAVAAARAALAVLSVNERDELLADLRTSTPTPAVRPSNAASSAAPSGAADIRLTSSTLPDTTPAPVPMDVAVGADQDSPVSDSSLTGQYSDILSSKNGYVFENGIPPTAEDGFILVANKRRRSMASGAITAAPPSSTAVQNRFTLLSEPVTSPPASVPAASRPVQQPPSEATQSLPTRAGRIPPFRLADISQWAELHARMQRACSIPPISHCTGRSTAVVKCSNITDYNSVNGILKELNIPFVTYQLPENKRKAISSLAMAASPAESAVAAARAALAALSVNERDELLNDLRFTSPPLDARPITAASSSAPSGAADLELTPTTLPDTSPAPVPMDVAADPNPEPPMMVLR
ncbi:uncharacterized protein [Hetaerina americana]|uniref:uncharacterized protein n=1 Tax=Hetaerina americana TaxID=62018 RepID=UPI003A7F4E87